MAKIYGEIATSALLTLDKSFARAVGQPLDYTEVYYSKAAAEAYAATPNAYVGQKIVVVETVDDQTTVTHYGIEADGSLKELGAVAVGDNATVEVIGGKIQLAGLGSASDSGKKYQPVLVNGKLTWQELSATTVEGLDASIKAVEGEVDALEAEVDAVDNRVTEIENDYLKSADKTELEGKIATAKTEAIEEAVTTVLGEGVSEDFDTLKEVADWILSDTTGAASLITRITAIENDYLKGEDKTALKVEIDDLDKYVGTLPSEATSSTVVAYIQEVVDNLRIGDYAKAADLNALTERMVAAEEKITALEEIGAEKNVIASVDTAQFVIDESRRLGLLDISMDKVTGLTEAIGNKVEKVEGYRLISQDESAKLEKLVLGEDGTVSISGEISASNVKELDSWITTNRDAIAGLYPVADANKLAGIAEGAEVNLINAVKVAGTELNITDKSVNIPVATADIFGVVKSSVGENKVAVAEDGTMEVGSINVNRLVQTEGESLILNGGSARQ